MYPGLPTPSQTKGFGRTPFVCFPGSLTPWVRPLSPSKLTCVEVNHAFCVAVLPPVCCTLDQVTRCGIFSQTMPRVQIIRTSQISSEVRSD